MSDEVYWGSLRPILQDLTDRIARLEQLLTSSGLASSGLQAPGQPTFGDDFESFDAVPASFGAQPDFGSPGQVAAEAHGIAPGAGQVGERVPADIVLLARTGKLIQAIQQYRKLTGVDVKQAKAIVEQAAARGY
jgi:hypothetical protein